MYPKSLARIRNDVGLPVFALIVNDFRLYNSNSATRHNETSVPREYAYRILLTRIFHFVGVIGEIELTDILQSHVGRYVSAQIIEHHHRNGDDFASSHRVR